MLLKVSCFQNTLNNNIYLMKVIRNFLSCSKHLDLQIYFMLLKMTCALTFL
jgi:hypothetical protein